MRDDVIKKLQEEVIIPEIVQKRAEEAFAAIREGQKKTEEAYTAVREGQKKNIQRERLRTHEDVHSGHRTRRNVRKRLWIGVTAAALCVGTITAGAAVYRSWSSSLGEGMQVSTEQQEMLEEAHMAVFETQSCTDQGITVTAVQSITDNYYTHIVFKVEGYELPANTQPDFERLEVTVDGKTPDPDGAIEEYFGYSANFYNGLIEGSDGKVVFADGTQLDDTGEENEFSHYVQADGSLEYQVTLSNTQNKGFFLNKPVHLELHNLGTVAQAEYTPDVEGTWSFDLNLEGSSMARECELGEVLGNTGATVVRAEISPISLVAEYEFPRQEDRTVHEGKNGETEDFVRNEDPPKLDGVKMKDGTIYPYLYQGPGSSGYVSEDSDIYRYAFAIDRIIDVDEVESLLFNKSWPENGQEPTEENYYVVPLK